MTTTDTLPTFSQTLRDRTSGDHRSVERNPFTGALVQGTLPLAGYTDLLAQHLYVYEQLESPAASVADDPAVKPLLHPGLLRSAALEADLTDLVGADWRTVHPPTPGTQAYAARVHEVAQDWAGGYAAHHYTRYLGDLSGGQFIGRVVAKAYGLTLEHGGRFAHFEGLGDITEFKNSYRAGLDAAGWDEDEQARVIEEIHAAYRFNNDVFEDLAHHVS